MRALLYWLWVRWHWLRGQIPPTLTKFGYTPPAVLELQQRTLQRYWKDVGGCEE